MLCTFLLLGRLINCVDPSLDVLTVLSLAISLGKENTIIARLFRVTKSVMMLKVIIGVCLPSKLAEVAVLCAPKYQS